jgi:hypothetical protein
MSLDVIGCDELRLVRDALEQELCLRMSPADSHVEKAG